MNHTTRRATRSIPIGTFDGATLPARDVTWTRLGSGMGYTNTAAKRAAIRAAVERMAWQDPVELTAVQRMAWQDPVELTAVLYAAPARQVITVLLGDRPWVLHRAALAELPPGPYGQRRRRLLGIELTTGERWVLLDDCGYEWIHLYTDHPVRERAERRPRPESDR